MNNVKSKDKKQEEKQQEEINVDDLRKMNLTELKNLAVKIGLPQKGNKKELFNNIQVKLFGGSERFVPGKTACRVCGARMTVTGTSTRRDEETKKLYITRNLKCLGKRGHRYPMTEII